MVLIEVQKGLRAYFNQAKTQWDITRLQAILNGLAILQTRDISSHIRSELGRLIILLFVYLFAFLFANFVVNVSFFDVFLSIMRSMMTRTLNIYQTPENMMVPKKLL